LHLCSKSSNALKSWCFNWRTVRFAFYFREHRANSCVGRRWKNSPGNLLGNISSSGSHDSSNAKITSSQLKRYLIISKYKYLSPFKRFNPFFIYYVQTICILNGEGFLMEQMQLRPMQIMMTRLSFGGGIRLILIKD
jgi:hypothetical protein